ncbi:hypothetical protein ACFX1W_039392 [Malus domestica]
MSSPVNDPRQPSAAKRYVPCRRAAAGSSSRLLRSHRRRLRHRRRHVPLQVVFLGCDYILCSIAGEHEELGERPQTDLHGHDVCYYGIGNQLLRTCSTGDTKELKFLERELRCNAKQFRFI